jgi:glutamate synthase (NADPH) large chain
LSMVDLEPIHAEEEAHERHNHQSGDLETHGRVDIMHDMNKDDAMRLRFLIEQHRRYTHSERARLILENWDKYLPKFVKVMPVEYRRALQEMQKEHSEHTHT